MTFQSFFAPRPCVFVISKTSLLWARTPTSLISSVEGQTQEGSDGGRKTKAAGQRRPCRRPKNESYVRRASGSKPGEGGREGASLAVEPPWPQLPSAWPRPPPSISKKIHLHEGGRFSGNAALLFLNLKSWDRIKLDLNYFIKRLIFPSGRGHFPEIIY